MLNFGGVLVVFFPPSLEKAERWGIQGILQRDFGVPSESVQDTHSDGFFKAYSSRTDLGYSRRRLSGW